MITLDERDASPERQADIAGRRMANNLRVAMPGIVTSFNSKEQTVSVRCAVRERLTQDGTDSWVEIPVLVDVPIVLPRAGGYALTLPVKAGDECLVIFGDNCIDAWWQSGGVQNQIDLRRHDLSDSFAVLGPWSQPRVLPNYSTGSAQLRNESGSAYIEISGNTINIVAGTVNIGSSTKIDGKVFLAHKHSGVTTGGSNTGGVS